MKAIQVAILGASGRMGRALVSAIGSDQRFRLAGAVVSENSPLLGEGLGSEAAAPGVNFVAAMPTCDVVIDFSSPAGLCDQLSQISERKIALVTGTTGLSHAQSEMLTEAATKIPVLAAANMSLGIQIVHRLVAAAAAALGDKIDVEIAETHHRNKRDAPSGTALALGQTAAAARGQQFADVAQLSREGADCLREPGQIGFASQRLGDVVGEHTVTFGMAGERLEITHRAASRDAFVQGALEAAAFLVGQTPGQYQMSDVVAI